MEPVLQIYTERARLHVPDNSDLTVIEDKLAWIVHIIAAILKIKQCTGCSVESQEVLDAELSARVLQLINVTDSGIHSQVYCTKFFVFNGLEHELSLFHSLKFASRHIKL
ncbi:uncharacterized protein LOC109790680 [Cajanus cajan]|uniref:uncharacterized protein LOC109790680 n=1 Tax=Cajanus cajan TaxID=3821 RepID=UPI00098D8076|nr:uncharacterized protein LOC109790680 [Cajanus cajan]